MPERVFDVSGRTDGIYIGFPVAMVLLFMAWRINYHSCRMADVCRHQYGTGSVWRKTIKVSVLHPTLGIVNDVQSVLTSIDDLSGLPDSPMVLCCLWQDEYKQPFLPGGTIYRYGCRFVQHSGRRMSAFHR